jgi:hypothetical protein
MRRRVPPRPRKWEQAVRSLGLKGSRQWSPIYRSLVRRGCSDARQLPISQAAAIRG